MYVWQSIWHIFWHSGILSGIYSELIPTYFLAFYLASILTFFLASIAIFWSVFGSSSVPKKSVRRAEAMFGVHIHRCDSIQKDGSDGSEWRREGWKFIHVYILVIITIIPIVIIIPSCSLWTSRNPHLAGGVPKHCFTCLARFISRESEDDLAFRMVIEIYNNPTATWCNLNRSGWWFFGKTPSWKMMELTSIKGWLYSNPIFLGKCRKMATKPPTRLYILILIHHMFIYIYIFIFDVSQYYQTRDVLLSDHGIELTTNEHIEQHMFHSMIRSPWLKFSKLVAGWHVLTKWAGERNNHKC